jgi:hypothetical protein
MQICYGAKMQTSYWSFLVYSSESLGHSIFKDRCVIIKKCYNLLIFGIFAGLVGEAAQRQGEQQLHFMTLVSQLCLQ